LSLVLLAAWAGRPCGAQATDAPAAPPANTPATPATLTTDAQIARAIADLGDADFDVRERATRALWASGSSAEPALRAALEEASPEVAGRIRTILTNIGYGITPDMSAEVIDLLARYRAGTPGVKRQVADTLAQQGAPGARVLLKLRNEERDAATRAGVTVLLARRAREMAVTLIAEGDVGTAGQILAVAAESGDGAAAMNYGAFLRLQGGLVEQIAAAAQRLDEAAAAAAGGNGNDGADPERDVRHAAQLLTYLHRANGDLPAARAAAERTGDEELLHNILIEIGDWRALADRAAAAIDADGGGAPLEALSFATAFHRLAGDAAGADRFAAMLRASADRGPDQAGHAAEGLFLNGYVELGLDLLSRHNQLGLVAEFHRNRLAYDELPRLLERARARDAGDLRRVEAVAARALWDTGDGAGAAALLAEAATGCERRRDFDGFSAVIGVAHDVGLAEQARWYAVAAAQVAVANPAAVAPAEQRDPLAEMFASAKARDAARSAAWWRLLRQRFPRQPAGQTLETVRAVDEKRMTGDDLQALCDASAEFTAKLPPDERGGPLELIADTLADAGRRDAAVRRYEELAGLAESANPARAAAALGKLAAFDVAERRWRAAADRYHRAWSRDRAQPVPLYLSGWALAQAGGDGDGDGDGDAAAGKQRMERAHLIPLADESLRHGLYRALAERGLTDEAVRERDLILRTARFMSQPRSEALRRAGDDAHAAGRLAAAADLWERAYLDNNHELTRFVEPWFNVLMPALIRRTRVVGLIRDGNVPQALKEADACLALAPGDTDTLIEIVAALDAAGHTPEAEALYRRVAARYEHLSQRYPNSGMLHNLCAWAAARCGRDLDGALAHATRGVELEPASAAILDTLAEVHFRRGDVRAAIAAARRCAEMEPDEPHYKAQLERFTKAAAEAAARKG
jgi:hypothetical protein